MNDHADVPLSVNQEAALFGGSRTIMQLLLKVSGALDYGVLQASLDLLLARHAPLRTGFTVAPAAAHAGRPTEPSLFGTRRHRLAPGAAARVLLDLRDLEGRGHEDALAEVQRVTLAEVQRPFELARPPLMRAILFRLGAARHVLVVLVDHIACDRWSMDVIRHELFTIYDALSQGLPNPLPQLPVAYADFARRQWERLRGGALDDAVAYWRRQWHEFGAVQLQFRDLPFAAPSARDVRFSASRELVHLDAAASGRLRWFARQHRVTPFAVLVAAVVGILGSCTGKTAIALWVPFANRTRPNTEAIVGPVSNLHLVGVHCDPSGRLIDLLHDVRNALLDAVRHQEVPIPYLWSLVQPTTFFSDLWAFVDMVVATPQRHAGRLTVETVRGPGLAAGRGLEMLFIEANGGVDLLAGYPSERLRQPDVAGLLRAVAGAAEAMVRTPSRRLTEFAAGGWAA